jgi:hypothetical protein
MALTVVRFFSLLFAALALVPALAHLSELPHKIHMSANDYLVVQQIYRGWALFGIVVIAALLSTLILTLMTRHDPWQFRPSLTAFLAIAATQVVFWTSTYPVNKATSNWTRLPSNWEALRQQWEYSHATSSVLALIALIAVIVAVLQATKH